jgi:hypothetical protein
MMAAAVAGERATPQPGVTFRRVLILCLPALLLAILVRLSFLVAIPEIFYGSDSNSYFEAAWKLWTHGDLALNAKRRFLYPIVLMFTPLVPGGPTVGLAIIQHVLGLATIVGIGWIVAQMTRFPNVWVPLATCLVAVWPRMLWFEHEMMAEPWLLAAFVAAVAVAVPCGSLKDPKRLFWFLVANAAIVATKPHGRPLWLGLMLVGLLMAGNPLKWGWKNLVMVAFALLMILTTGSDQQGSWLFLNSTLPFVKTEGEPYAEYRAILRPYVEQARADLANYAWKQKFYKKPLSGSKPMLGEKWVELSKNQELYDKVANRLAFEAIFNHPLEYGQLVLRKIARAGSNMTAGKIPPPFFWHEQEKANDQRIGKPNSQLELVYGMDLESYRRLVEERRDRPMPIAPWLHQLGAWFSWADAHAGEHGAPPAINLGILGWLLVLGLIACLSPRYFVCRMLLWLPAALYLFAVFAVGDSVRRYLHPVDWVGIVIIAIGLDTIATLVAGGIGRLRGRMAEMDPPSPSARVEGA